jgi:hypothetical protein
MKRMLMMRMILILVFLAGMSWTMYPKQLMKLPEIVGPINITVDGDNVYIVQKDAISLYSMKTKKLVKTFGKKGEGPGEFRSTPTIEVQEDRLIIDSIGKILFYSKDGEFINEMKPQISMSYNYLPVGKQWVGMKLANDMNAGKSTIKIDLFDKELKSIKEIASMMSTGFKQTSEGKLKMAAVRDLLTYQVSGDKIILGNTSKGFYFEVLDSNGKKLYEIKKEYKNQPFTETHKKEFLEAMEQNPMFRRYKDRYEFEYREFFPAYRNFIVADGKLYVFLNETKDKTTKVMVMDLKGNLLKTVYLPSKVHSSIRNDHFYYLLEDEETEEWGLYVIQI